MSELLNMFKNSAEILKKNLEIHKLNKIIAQGIVEQKIQHGILKMEIVFVKLQISKNLSKDM